MDTEIKRELERINKKLNLIVAGQKKDTWVGPSWLVKVTGWNREELRQAREQGIIEYKRSSGGGWLYRLESVPEQFILQNSK